VLLREVHHRVKNNLQLIASIMNMQMRRAKSPETKALMKGLQERVMSLATVHKELYQTTGLADVRADELLGDLVRQIVGMASAPGGLFRIETTSRPIPLAPGSGGAAVPAADRGAHQRDQVCRARSGRSLAPPRAALCGAGRGRAELVHRPTPLRRAAAAVRGTGLGSPARWGLRKPSSAARSGAGT
jgi:hypothetical protein